jgi:hypothetical protein
MTIGGAAVLAAGALPAAPRAHAQTVDGLPLVGSWLVAGIPPGAPAPPPRILVSFTGDGIALRTAPMQQAAPPALGTDKMFISATHGAWLLNADGTYGLTFIGLAFDESGRFLATQHVRVTVQVNENQFDGPFRTDFVGADGQVLASASGTVQARRIEVEALA